MHRRTVRQVLKLGQPPERKTPLRWAPVWEALSARKQERCAPGNLDLQNGVDLEDFTQSHAAATEPLMRVLVLANGRFTDNHLACSAVGRSLVVTYLSETDRRTIRPRLPQDPCATRREVDEAHRELP